jgi:tetratricopeptide (TPR) repeat protein
VGDAAYKAADYNAALSAYGDATLYAAKNNYWPQLGLANTYYALSMPDKAYEAYGNVLEKDPGNVTAKLYRAKLEIAKTQPQPTPAAGAQDSTSTSGSPVPPVQLAALESLARDNPGNLDTQVTLAEVYAQQGNSNAAIGTYDKAVQLAPQNVDLLMALGAQWQKVGNYEQAKNVYVKGLTINDKLPQLYYNLGIVYNELGQLPKSVESYQKALALDPDNSDARYGLAITLEKQQKYRDALETYQTYSQNPQAHYIKEAQERIDVLKKALSSAAPATPAHTAPEPVAPHKPSTRIDIPVSKEAKKPVKVEAAHPPSKVNGQAQQKNQTPSFTSKPVPSNASAPPVPPAR